MAWGKEKDISGSSAPSSLSPKHTACAPSLILHGPGWQGIKLGYERLSLGRSNFELIGILHWCSSHVSTACLCTCYTSAQVHVMDHVIKVAFVMALGYFRIVKQIFMIQTFQLHLYKSGMDLLKMLLWYAFHNSLLLCNTLCR